MKPKLPIPDIVELEGKDAFDAMVEHFGVHVEDTIPIPLDERGIDYERTEREIEREHIQRRLARKRLPKDRVKVYKGTHNYKKEWDL